MKITLVVLHDTARRKSVSHGPTLPSLRTEIQKLDFDDPFGSLPAPDILS